jgi:hypothetical protein
MPLGQQGGATEGPAGPRVRARSFYLGNGWWPTQLIDRPASTDNNGFMAGFEIKTGERRFTLDDMDAVVGAVRSGRIGRAAQIRAVGSKAWTRIDATEELLGLFDADPWGAWETESDGSVLDDFQEEEPEKAPRLGPAPTLIDEVQELPEASFVSVDQGAGEGALMGGPITSAETTHPRGPRRPVAQVIDFPVARPVQTQGVHALDLLVSDSASKPPSKVPPSRSPVRWGPIIVIGSIATGTMLLWVWFVNINADANFVDKRRAVQTAPSFGASPAEVEPTISPYDTLEDATRAQMMDGILDIPGETEFEDALLIELRRVRVDVRSVRVKIETWAGRKKDVPDEVGFNLKVMERAGELDRDLGALGLVVGKYIQHYGLQVSSMNIIIGAEGGLRKLQMNPETARRYYNKRVSLERFLTTAFDAQ